MPDSRASASAGTVIHMETITDTPSTKRLERTSSDRIVAGVSGGLGRYFDLSPAFYRLGFVVLTLLGGAGILVYLAAVLVIPEEGEAESIADEALAERREKPWPLIGLGLVGVALAVLLARATIWPVAGSGWVLILIIGLRVLWASRGASRGRVLMRAVIATLRHSCSRSPSPRSLSASPGSTSASPTASATKSTSPPPRPRSTRPTRSASGTCSVDLSQRRADHAADDASTPNVGIGELLVIVPHDLRGGRQRAREGRRARRPRPARRRPERGASHPGTGASSSIDAHVGAGEIEVVAPPVTAWPALRFEPQRRRSRRRRRLWRTCRDARRRRDARPARLRAARARRRRRHPALPRTLGLRRRARVPGGGRARHRRRDRAAARARPLASPPSSAPALIAAGLAIVLARGGSLRPGGSLPVLGIALLMAGAVVFLGQQRHLARLRRARARSSARSCSCSAPGSGSSPPSAPSASALEERAEVAARIHDSVLQTLALVQRHADDPARVAALARRQERELRRWLYGGGVGAATTLADALAEAAADVEELHGVRIELASAGDVAARRRRRASSCSPRARR